MMILKRDGIKIAKIIEIQILNTNYNENYRKIKNTYAILRPKIFNFDLNSKMKNVK